MSAGRLGHDIDRLIGQAHELADQGQHTSALDLLDTRSAGMGDVEIGVVLTAKADICVGAHRFGEAVEHARRAIDLLEPSDPNEALAARMTMADALSDLGNLTAAEATYRAALEHYSSAADLAGQARATMELGTVASRRGDHAAADLWYADAQRLYLEAGDITTARITLGLNWATALRYLGRVPEAIERLDVAERHATATGVAMVAAHCVYTKASIAISSGDLAAGEAGMRTALDAYRSLNLPTEEADCVDRLGHVAMYRGDYESAVAHHQTALEIYSRHGLPVQRAGAQISLADCLTGMDRHAEAVILAGQAAADLDRHGHAPAACHGLSVVIAASQHLGRMNDVQAALERYEQLAAQRALPDPWLDIARGRVAAGQGQADEAERYFEAAVQHGSDQHDAIAVREATAEAADAFAAAGMGSFAGRWAQRAADLFIAAGSPHRAVRYRSSCPAP